ncbi:Cytochrome c [Roseovarius albus]|uniref:Cytochrome c n=1 Tax=Roseovarius albus TaxID=1247867 RepID=A0A1X6Y612_9RHOB|nr:cytochrome c [Roseovarius albus]SLN11590.1 Cytochrome c [Roseovarius albus]
MRSHILNLFIVGIGITALSACTTDTSNEMPTRADGAEFFSANCVSCHGSDAKGDGPAATGLPAAPPDLTLLSVQNGGEFPQTQTLSYIYGDPEKSHLARVMPEFGEDMALDLVPVELDGVLTPTPRELAGLLFYLESIQQ